jgi:5-methylcytosine-specific restriction endonuclease McrA
MRSKVLERDRGICSICKAQCRLGRYDWNKHDLDFIKKPSWQADHVVPVAEGGGLCGLDGYRTLCLPCHKMESKKLSQRLVEKRRGVENG